MKKNILRIISLALVAVMVFAFASCKQEILVRFVDKDGNDLFAAGSVNTGVNTTPGVEETTVAETPTEAPVGDTPTEAPTNAPVGDTPTEAPTNAPVDTPTEAPTNAPVDTPTEAPTNAPVEKPTEAPTNAPTEAPTNAPATSNAPSSKQDIVNFYAKAANDLKNNGAAGYTKKEWQVVDEININPLVNGAIKGVLGSFMTVEADAEEQVNAKGSDDAKRRSFGWTLTDLSKVASAKCEVLANGNYKITIVMVDEDTPKKTGSTLGQVTGALLYWEDIETTLTSDPTVTKILSEFSDIHVNYKHFTITAEMTPDGKFVALEHNADVDIILGHIKVIGINIDNKSGHMYNYCKFYNFKY
ncbi:MAG: hypothetical protein IJE93_05050 [Clostridia bacterium]|nr:hypothetical protein [Clostridia bacterium]